MSQPGARSTAPGAPPRETAEQQAIRAELSAIVGEIYRRKQRIADLSALRRDTGRMIAVNLAGALLLFVFEVHLLTLSASDLLRAPLASKPAVTSEIAAPEIAAPAPDPLPVRAPDAAPAQSVLSLPAAPGDVVAQPPPPPQPPPEPVTGPIDVPSLPWQGAGDTRAGADTIASYTCGPGFDESGPEIWYTLTVGEPGVLKARVAKAADEVDVDVHLLTARDGASCVARGDHSLTAEVAPGSYFIAVDTFRSPSGALRSGPYTLSLRLEPPGAPEEAEPPAGTPAP